MKSLSPFFCLLLLVVSASYLPAQSEVAEPTMLESGIQLGEVGILYKLADELPDLKRLHIEARVLIDGKVVHQEYLTIEPNHQASPVVELLIGNPQLADEVTILSADPGHTVTIKVLLNGELIETLSGIDAVARSESLLRQAVLPQDISSRFDLSAQATSAAKTTCLECWQSYDACQAQNCEPDLPPRLCDLCETALNYCLSTCEDPPCEPWDEYDYVVTWLSYYYTRYATCFRDNYWPQSPRLADEALVTARKDTYRITHNCDGSTTSTLISSYNIQDYCYHRRFPDDCYPGQSVYYRYNNCTF